MSMNRKDITLLIIEEVMRDHSRLRKVIFLFYDSEMEKRFIGAKTLNEAERRMPDVKRRWSRIFYVFDDIMSCWGAAEALGEIGRNINEMRSRIVIFLRKSEKDEVSC